MSAPLVWEELSDPSAGYIERTRVPGGWLVRAIQDVCSDDPNRGPLTQGHEWRVALAYVPDPNGEWLK